MSRDIKDLAPEYREKVQQFFDELQKDENLKRYGIEKIIVLETRRDIITQMAYFSRFLASSAPKGYTRSVKEFVIQMYKQAKLPIPPDAELLIPVTKTMFSKHLEGKAIDVAPFKDGAIWWNAPWEVWERMGIIGESFGFKWGGRWEDFRDKPHFEFE